jgi:hypothetical protein
MRLAAVVAILLLSGCSSLKTNSDAAFIAYSAERNAYSRCAIVATDQINSHGKRRPDDVAVAAKVLCASQRLALREAVSRNHPVDSILPIMSVYEDGFTEISIARSVNTSRTWFS